MGALMLTLCVSIFLLTVVWPDISGVGRSLSVRLALDREAARLGVKWTRVDQWESKKGNVSLGHGYVGLDSFLVVKEYRYGALARLPRPWMKISHAPRLPPPQPDS